jgi:hypothetical protein
MSVRILQVMTDDFDGTELKVGQGQTVAFSLADDFYEIDLSDKNLKRLQIDFEPWISKARRPAGAAAPTRRRARSARTSKAAPKVAATQNADVRIWARENGLSVSSRGRIAADVLAAYTAAH